MAAAILGSFTTTGHAQQLFAIAHAGNDGLSTLYSVNPADGGITAVGPIGFQRCGSMDFSAARVAYAACERDDGSDTPVLVTVDVTTGAGTEVGPTGISGSVSDISFHPVDDTLYVFDASNDPEHTLFTMDVTTGAATEVGDTGLSDDGGNGMAFDAAGSLFHSARETAALNTLDTGAGSATNVGSLTLPPAFVDNPRVSAMDEHEGLLWATLKLGSGSGAGAQLVTIDTAGLVVTNIGPTGPNIDAIAWLPAEPVVAAAPPPPPPEPPRPVPMGPAWLASLMAAALGAIGLCAARRRKIA